MAPSPGEKQDVGKKSVPVRENGRMGGKVLVGMLRRRLESLFTGRTPFKACPSIGWSVRAAVGAVRLPARSRRPANLILASTQTILEDCRLRGKVRVARHHAEKGPQPGGRRFSVLLEAVKATGDVFSAAYPRRVSIFGIVVGTKMDCFFKANAVQSKKLGGRASRNPPGRAESQFAGRTLFKTCPVLGGA